MSRANAKYRRSILLGVLALASLVWVATDQFGIPKEEMVGLFVTTVLGMVVIILVAASTMGCWFFLRWLIRKKTKD